MKSKKSCIVSVPQGELVEHRCSERPPGQGEGREQSRPAPRPSQGILGENADGKDIPPIIKREGLLLSRNGRIKNSLYKKCVCLWAHRSCCCLAASVGIYCLPLQFSKKVLQTPSRTNTHIPEYEHHFLPPWESRV